MKPFPLPARPSAFPFGRRQRKIWRQKADRSGRRLAVVLTHDDHDANRPAARKYLSASRGKILAGHAAPRCPRGWRLCVRCALHAHLLQALLPGAEAATPQRRFFSHGAGSGEPRVSSLPALPPERTAGALRVGDEGGRGIGEFGRGKRAARCVGGSDWGYSRKIAAGVSPHDRADTESLRPSVADDAV